MAQKRMFDRAIVDTEKFTDMPMSSKALYFLLGMEADDEGFVSAKRVMKIHGAQEDDLNILLAKEYVIKFKSGVVVITHWKKNNWLDSRRIRKSEYCDEKKQVVNIDGNYVLSERLANAKPVESRIEENRIVASNEAGNANAGNLERSEKAERIVKSIGALVRGKKMS